VRVDVRSDSAGDLHILEVNPKPDLKKPVGTSTSLVMAGPSAEGISYNDMIFGLLADRLHHLLNYERAVAEHIVNLLIEGNLATTARSSECGTALFHAVPRSKHDIVMTA
jgi:D-alanine-D-alanine ligase